MAVSHLSSILTDEVRLETVPKNYAYGNTPRGSISGVVRINGQLPTQPYRVRSHRAEDGLLVVETWCAAGTGAYTVSDLELGVKHVNIAYDHTGTFPCAATAQLEPTP